MSPLLLTVRVTQDITTTVTTSIASRGGAAVASSSNVVHKEVAQSANPAGSNLQSPIDEKSNYNDQEKNKDLSTSEKNNTKSKAQNQPAQEDTKHYEMPLEQPDEPPDERTG